MCTHPADIICTRCVPPPVLTPNEKRISQIDNALRSIVVWGDGDRDPRYAKLSRERRELVNGLDEEAWLNGKEITRPKPHRRVAARIRVKR